MAPRIICAWSNLRHARWLPWHGVEFSRALSRAVRTETGGLGLELHVKSSSTARMRPAVYLVALFFIAVGVWGLASPESLMAFRQQHASTSDAYVIVVLRTAMMIVLFLFAPASRAPWALRTLAAISCLQILALPVLGLEGARGLQEWEATRTPLLRVGALIALACGSFLVFAATKRSRQAAN
jgi:hypothetical protein